MNRPAPGNPSDHHPAKAHRSIVGLIPEAAGPMTAEHRAALDQCRDLIKRRANDLAERAITARPSWIRRLGPPPTDPETRARWTGHDSRHELGR